MILAVATLALIQPVQLCWDPIAPEKNSVTYTVPAGRVLEGGVRGGDGQIYLILTEGKTTKRTLVRLDSHGQAEEAELPKASIVSLPYLREGQMSFCTCLVRTWPVDPKSFGDPMPGRPDGKMGDVVEYRFDDALQIERSGHEYSDLTDLSNELAPGPTVAMAKLRWSWTGIYYPIFWSNKREEPALVTVAPLFAWPGTFVYADRGGCWLLKFLDTKFVSDIGQIDSDRSTWTLSITKDLLDDPVHAVVADGTLYETIRVQGEPNRFLTLKIVDDGKEAKVEKQIGKNMFVLPKMPRY